MVLWTKLWFYGQNYGTIPRTIERQFTKDKNMVDYQELKNFPFIYNGKNSVKYQNN